jgi:formate hydrogenlyase transcriptional activator
VSELRESATRTPSGRSSLVESMATRMLVRNPITHSPKAVTGRETRRATPSEDSFVLLRLVAESLPNGVLVVDHNRGIVLANQQIERQFDYCRNDLLGQSIDLLLPEGGLTESSQTIGLEQKLSGRRRDGLEFPIAVTLSPLKVEQGLFTLVSVVDLTERHELEQAASLAIDRKVEFERLIAELSVQFINLPADQVIESIRDAIRRIGETLDVDRCSFFRIIEGEPPAGPIAWWGRPGVAIPTAVTPYKDRLPWTQDTILDGNVVSFSSLAGVPNEVDRGSYRTLDVRAAVTVPIAVSGQIVGALDFMMLQSERTWTEETLHTMRVTAAVLGNILARCETDETLRQSILQIEHAGDRTRVEGLYLRREVQERAGTGVIIGQSQAIRNVLELARQVAATDSTVLLLGETGTGKELVAAYVHEMSARRGRIMVRVNCSAIPSTLMESELFGREKGAFTGALARQIGRFELADHSTIFLDEIGDLPQDVQVKLLRVLEERQVERLGSPKGVHVDVRIIAATHRNLEKRIADGSFRDDLFYRLNVFPIQVPPLKDRAEDIPLLVWRFVDEFSRAFGKRIDGISREDMAVLQRYSWPGNIRELRNVVERAMIVSTGTQLSIPLPAVAHPAGKRSLKLNDMEREHILSVLDSSGWRIRGAAGAASLLGLKPTTLEARMAKLGLTRPKRA